MTSHVQILHLYESDTKTKNLKVKSTITCINKTSIVRKQTARTNPQALNMS